MTILPSKVHLSRTTILEMTASSARGRGNNRTGFYILIKGLNINKHAINLFDFDALEQSRNVIPEITYY
jgi:hypothetical protein